MSNTYLRSSDTKDIKTTLINLISSGYVEAKALTDCGVTLGQFLRFCQEDPEFIKDIEEARRTRAEFWVSKIAENIDIISSKEDVPGERLRLDKLMFLAKADNPDRYGNGSKSKIDISIDLKQFKLLPPDEAVKALAADPFAIDAEFKEIEEDLL